MKKMGFSIMTLLLLVEILVVLLPQLSNAVDHLSPFPTNFLFGTASSSYQVCVCVCIYIYICLLSFLFSLSSIKQCVNWIFYSMKVLITLMARGKVIGITSLTEVTIFLSGSLVTRNSSGMSGAWTPAPIYNMWCEYVMSLPTEPR
jgi:hypothetical protein